MDSQQSHWEGYWRGTCLSDLLGKTRHSGELGEFTTPFLMYLPRTGSILEAGCGTGKYVAALQARGFDIEGIDFAEGTVSRVRAANPEIQVSVGDITAIDRPDQHYGAYISIGVVEHFFDGPERGLNEAFRVLMPGGIALITVPLLNLPRRKLLQTATGIDDEVDDSGWRFYQYFFDPNDFRHRLEGAGFHVVDVHPYLVFGGLIRDSAVGRWLHRNSFFSYRLMKFVKRECAKAPKQARSHFAHMVLFACRKPGRSNTK
jgi:SAM-dependent methyltransferase